MSQVHNENSRVKIPAILHLMRLGYDYLSLKNENWDKQTNIFPEIFIESLCRINPDLSPDDARRLLADIRLELDNEDLGQKFYERLINQSGGKKLIDFQNFNNNSFHVVTELPCINGDEEIPPRHYPAGKRHAFGLYRSQNAQQQRRQSAKSGSAWANVRTIPNSAVLSTSPNS